ncbi:hypothetical protein [Lactiplantibacillus plantarum]|uniref:hypothetical protein n=1 Tax=Lactiplantibacillus plantarum TaxID=1590 RepID=UPI0021CAE483|nr:hypothetical protein [Lactiplantibacillus plantarum]
MSKYGIINHRPQWQAMLHATDHGRKITSLTQLNQILRAANLHSFAVANLRQVEHATRPTKTLKCRPHHHQCASILQQSAPITKTVLDTTPAPD